MSDAFIIHHKENRPWVAALADNLKRCGVEVWLDLRAFAAGLAHEGLRQAKYGILLASPEALESGQAGDGYAALLARRREDPDFRIVVLRFGGLPDYALPETPWCVDFADPMKDAYLAAFRQLLRALRDLPADADIELPDGLTIPAPFLPRLGDMPTRPVSNGEAGFLGSVFKALDANRPLMLLGQAEIDKTPLHQALLAQARRRFGAENTLHLVPSGRADIEKGDYFTYLGDQISKENFCLRSSDFEFLMADCLARGQSMFLLMTRLEDGSAEGLQALSHALRNLSERYSDWLKVVLSGGKQVLGLRFREGNLSPLRKANLLYWPVPTATDLLQWQKAEGLSLSEKNAAILLRLTGGNPHLLRQGLRMLRQTDTPDWASLAETLKQDPVLRARFAAYREQGEAARVAELLKRDDLGHYEPWPLHPLMRRLYWDGFLVERRDRFRWCSDLIRLLGQEAMGG